MEKTFRVLGDEDENADAHGHSHSHSHTSGVSTAISTQSHTNGDLRSRHSKENGVQEGHEKDTENEKEKMPNTSKLSAYLNLFGDFTHNMSVSPPSSRNY